MSDFEREHTFNEAADWLSIAASSGLVTAYSDAPDLFDGQIGVVEHALAGRFDCDQHEIDDEYMLTFDEGSTFRSLANLYRQHCSAPMAELFVALDVEAERVNARFLVPLTVANRTDKAVLSQVLYAPKEFAATKTTPNLRKLSRNNAKGGKKLIENPLYVDRNPDLEDPEIVAGNVFSNNMFHGRLGTSSF